MRPDVCLYHKNCLDGFSAAYAVWRRWADVIQYIPVDHGQPPPDINGKHVLIVDFAYPKAALEAMSATAKTITVIDHHASAEHDLEEFAILNPVDYADIDIVVESTQPGLGNIRSLFDNRRSGATLTWMFCHPDRMISPLFLFVEDADLGRYKMENSREINAALRSYHYEFPVWAALDTRLRTGQAGPIITEGKTIIRAFNKQLAETLENCKRFMIIGGHRVPVCNLPPAMAPEGAKKLAEGQLFAATYYDRSDGQRAFSLHSRDGFDVSEVAKLYGGGGHKDASGFRAKLDWNGDT